MKIFNFLIFVVVLSLLSVVSGASQTLPVPVPPTQGPSSSDFSGVVDYAHLIDTVHTDQLNSLLRELKQKTTASIVVLTTETGSQKLDRTQAEAYASLIYKEWNLANVTVDNTVLFLVTTDESHQTFQSVIYRGKIMKEIIDNLKVERLIDKFFTPAIEQKEYFKGIYETTWALAYIVAQVYQKTLSPKPPFESDPLAEPGGSANTALWIIGLVILIAFVYHRVKRANPEFSWLSWLPGRRTRAIAQDASWRGAFERGYFGGLK